MRIVTFLFLLPLLACQQSKSRNDAPKPLSPLSYWLVKNEDSIFFHFSQRIKADTLEKLSANETLDSREYQFESGYIGKLTNKINDYDSCIEVYYLYKPQEQPSYQILLSPDYNKKCLTSIDTLFNDIDSLKHFRIVKYQPADGMFSDFIVESDTVKAEEIYFKIIPNKEKYNLEVFVNKKLSDLTEESLLSSIFGEEVRLKKFDTVRFIIKKEPVVGSMTLKEVRKSMGVKD
jgi:hypothetical protein